MFGIREQATAEKKSEARDRILTAAEQIFLYEGSYEKATIREIARRAGVSVGAVYLHFTTKLDILAAMTVSRVVLMRERLAARIPADGTGLEKLDASLTFITELRSDPFFALQGRLPLVRLDDSLNTDFQVSLRTEMQGFMDIHESILRQGRDDGTLRGDLDPRTMSVTFLIMVDAFMGQMLPDNIANGPYCLMPEIPQADLIAAFMEIIRSSLLPQAGAVPKA